MTSEWKLVPTIPTDDMIVAFAEAWYSKRQAIDDPDMLDAYRDMLAVAPQPPVLGGEPEVLLQARAVGDRKPSAWADVRDTKEREQMERGNALAEARDQPSMYEFRELIDRAHAAALLAKIVELERWQEEVRNSSELLRQRDAALAERDTLKARCEALEAALKFYADREHYHFESGNWDTVSGEPLNILWCGDEPDFVEDGSVARAVLAAPVAKDGGESRVITLSGCNFTEHELIGRAVRAATGTSRRGVARWIAMKDAFGCGSGVANALCRRFNFDPDEVVKP